MTRLQLQLAARGAHATASLDVASQQQHQGDVDMADALMFTGQDATAAAAAAGTGSDAAGAGSTWALSGAAGEDGGGAVDGDCTAAAVAAEATPGGGAQLQFARPARALMLPTGYAGGGTAATVGSDALVGTPTINVSAGDGSAAWVCEDLQSAWRVIVSHSHSVHMVGQQAA